MLEGRMIYHHLRTNLLIQWSMGFHSPKTIGYGLQFGVDGLAFKGTVRIRYDRERDSYVLFFINEQGQQIRKMWDIKLDNLIPTLQRNIDGVHGDWWQNFKKRYVFNQIEK